MQHRLTTAHRSGPLVRARPAHPGRWTGRGRTAAAAAAALLLAGCGTVAADEDSGTASRERAGATAEVAFPVEVDDCGRAVTLDAPPERVLTIGQAALWLVEAAGAGDRVVARSGEFDAPVPDALTDVAAGAEVIDPSDPSLEKVVGAEADAVVGYGLFSTIPEDLASAGITNLTVLGECGHSEGEAPPSITFQTVFDDVERLGTVFATTEEADLAVADLSNQVEELRSRAGRSRSAASVYYFSSSSALSAYGGAGIGHEQLTSAGLENVYGDEAQNYLDTSIETLLSADPEVVVLVHGLYGESAEEALARFQAEPGAADLEAVREGRIIAVPADQVTPSPGAVDGLRTIVDGLAALS